MTDFANIDEDHLDRESPSDLAATDTPSADLQSPPSADGDTPDAKLARKKPGRKPGLPKSPGSGRLRYKLHGSRLSQEDLQAIVNSFAAPLLKRTYEIAMGNTVMAGAATGKEVRQRPSLRDQMRAIELILSRTVPSLSSTEAPATEEQGEALRKAVLEDMLSRVSSTQQSTPVENTPDKPDTMSDMSADIRDMTRLRDNPEPMSFADLMADPKLLRLAQKDRSKAINSLDEIVLVWHDKLVFTHCDFADDSEVILLKAPTINRRDRSREPYCDGQYAVRPLNGKWAAIRISDGVRMGNLYDRFEGARAEIWNLTGVRVG
jgi:hypothetical protein